MENVMDRIRRGWNAFMNKDPTYFHQSTLASTSHRPDRPRLTKGNERSIITAIYNRMAMDAAAVNIAHVKLDDDGRYIETIDDGLNQCLTVEANLDQTARAFKQDIYLSMFDEGCIAIIPIDTSEDPNTASSYDIFTMRTARILEWYPSHVKIQVYNEKTGKREEVVVHKSTVSIVENPFYAVMNEPNSTAKRLIRKLNILDAIDEQSGSGKLDLIIQLPYTIKTEARRRQAISRRDDITEQLTNSRYGIAYMDATERITQLNRPVENNLMKQIEYLTSTLYSQLSITQSIMDGTADEKTMNNYMSRSIEPVVAAPVDEMKRKFLSKTARSEKQSIVHFINPFKLIPPTQLAEMADKLTRNEIMSTNEFRQEIGMKPSKDPRADELRNKNLSEPSSSKTQAIVEKL